MARIRIGRVGKLMVACQVLDGLTFLMVSGSYGITGESGPIVKLLWAVGRGPLVIIFVKVLVIWWALAMAGLAFTAGTRWMGLTLLGFAAMIGLAGAITNVWSLIILRGAV